MSAYGGDQVLSGTGVAWRMTAVACVVAALAYGTYRNTDDLFPFGPLAQFATSPDLDGTVRAVLVLADTAGGQRVTVPLSPTGTGVGRAEIEGQLGRFTAQPELLQEVADGFHRVHPGRDRLVRLYLVREMQRLEDGEPSGAPTMRLLAEWEVR